MMGSEGVTQVRYSEQEAFDLIKIGNYEEALLAYTCCIQSLNEDSDPSDRIRLLLQRSTCFTKLKLFEKVLEDCRDVLEYDRRNEKAFQRRIKALCSLGKVLEAKRTADYWTGVDPENAVAKKEQESLDNILNTLQVQAVESLDADLEPPQRGGAGNDDGLDPSLHPPPSSSKSKTKSDANTSIPTKEKSIPSHTLPCDVCNMMFETREDYRLHCTTDAHKARDVGHMEERHHWKCRPPPRGLTDKEYSMCTNYLNGQDCTFGAQCTQAHSYEELEEWKARFTVRCERLKKHTEQHTCTYAEQVLERYMTTEQRETVITDSLEGIAVHVNADLTVTMNTKQGLHVWLFTVTSKYALKRVALLDDILRHHFHIASITIGPKRHQRSQQLAENAQEWTNNDYKEGRTENEKVYRIKILCQVEIFGTFKQMLLLDFGSEPIIGKEMCVQSAQVSDIDSTSSKLCLSDGGKWDLDKSEVVPFPERQGEDWSGASHSYPTPSVAKFNNKQELQDVKLTRENYKTRMHDMLYIEELARYSQLSRYNIDISLQLAENFMLCPSSTSTSTAKYAHDGQLFARMKVNAELSEDTEYGRLVLQNVNIAYVAASEGSGIRQPKKIYEAIVEEKGKDFVFLRLSAACVKDHNLRKDGDFKARVQFHLNRQPFLEQHLAIDHLEDLDVVFPKIVHTLNKSLQRESGCSIDSKLNVQQQRAVKLLLSPDTLSPVLLAGPYGTGKTFTLSEATKHIVQQENTRVLICTHSNSAADLYIRDYFHRLVTETGDERYRPLRIIYKLRWVQTVSHEVLPYCLLDENRQGFVTPTLEQIQKHRIIVTTLSTSRCLYDLGLEDDYFSHILVDEAAQALETETLIPLVLAGKNTKIALAGDHMQLSPEVFSRFAVHHKFDMSLLERLFHKYSKMNQCRVLLNHNYRSHSDIVRFTSELFYNNNLISSGNQPRHPKFNPLSFFTVQGEDMQHLNSTAFYNQAEVLELVERVSELLNDWPSEWGPKDGKIGVVTPYADQVIRIRAELRAKKIYGVSVERVLNVQGKEFRAMFLSTVRTQHTCYMAADAEEGGLEYGFLSNAKLLNTAITRAQSLIAVVGDPVSLCTVGKCRKLWERYIETAHLHGGLYGITWRHLTNQLGKVELKKTYILNPLAPEFVPNRRQHLTMADLEAGQKQSEHQHNAAKNQTQTAAGGSNGAAAAGGSNGAAAASGSNGAAAAMQQIASAHSKQTKNQGGVGRGAGGSGGGVAYVTPLLGAPVLPHGAMGYVPAMPYGAAYPMGPLVLAPTHATARSPNAAAQMYAAAAQPQIPQIHPYYQQQMIITEDPAVIRAFQSSSINRQQTAAPANPHAQQLLASGNIAGDSNQSIKPAVKQAPIGSGAPARKSKKSSGPPSINEPKGAVGMAESMSPFAKVAQPTSSRMPYPAAEHASVRERKNSIDECLMPSIPSGPWSNPSLAVSHTSQPVGRQIRGVNGASDAASSEGTKLNGSVTTKSDTATTKEDNVMSSIFNPNLGSDIMEPRSYANIAKAKPTESLRAAGDPHFGTYSLSGPTDLFPPASSNPSHSAAAIAPSVMSHRSSTPLYMRRGSGSPSTVPDSQRHGAAAGATAGAASSSSLAGASSFSASNPMGSATTSSLLDVDSGESNLPDDPLNLLKNLQVNDLGTKMFLDYFK